MQNIFRTFIVTLVLALAVTASAATWKTDPAHSMVSFNVKHMIMTTVRGDFTKFDATVDFDESNPSTFSLTATADVASIDTRNEKRDAHLKSADFFDAEKTPTLTLVSKKVEQVADGHYKMTADLTMRGVTKEVVFDVTGFNGTRKTPWGGSVMSALATATINRKEWGLNWNKPLESGGVLVSDEVKIVLDVELVKQEQS